MGEDAQARLAGISQTVGETALILCVDFGDINIATFVAAIAAGGVLVVTKPGAHAATWVAKSLHLISTRCPLCCPAASRRVGAARRVVIVRRKFDAVALTVAAGCARTCPLCECVSVSATETNTVQEPVLRFSAGFGQLLFADAAVVCRQTLTLASILDQKMSTRSRQESCDYLPQGVRDARCSLCILL